MAFVPAVTGLPSGTVTFVFTDIEGSTQRWDRHRAAMEIAVRRHDALMRAAIANHRGVVFKTIGDAFCVAFSKPEDAIGALVEAQQALVAEDFSAVDGLRVRAAVHTGTADERDGDYFGPTLNRVARLLGVAHGGQSLVSGATAELSAGALAADIGLLDLGEHRLRDLSRPERVYQLLAPGLPADFPPLRSLSVISNNLPYNVKSFIARDAEIAAITALLEQHRLVTLAGSGGIGKTRTSLQVAANLLDDFADGVWSIDLAPLTNGEFVASAVAQVLAITLPPDGDAGANLARAIKAKHVLLLFDNCEHMVDPAARTVATLLRECPLVKVLATSRQTLGIEGEATFRMPPLSVPTTGSDAGLTPVEAGRFSAIALFVDRARAVDNRFELTTENAPLVADICRRLDGIPLAIELAASRLRMLGPRQLRDRLDERFRLLTGGSRDVLPRQQTLRALIDWSYDLLDERERTLFRRLGIFVSGFTLDGAIAVGTGDELDDADVFDALASLVEKSLVLAEADGDASRYRLLESTRAYASEKLAAAGERDVIARRHLHHFLERFIELRAESRRTGRHSERGWALETELEELRAALDWALARPDDVIDGARLAAELGNVWEAVGLAREGLARNEAFFAAVPRDQSHLLATLAGPRTLMLLNSSRYSRALEAATEGCDFARASGDATLLAESLEKVARVNVALTKYDAAEIALAELESMSSVVTEHLRKRLLATRGSLYSFTDRLDEAALAYEEIRETERALGNVYNEQVQVVNLSIVEFKRGRTERAIALVREVLPAVKERGDASLLNWVLSCYSAYLIEAGDLTGAFAAARDAIANVEQLDPDNTLGFESIELTETIEHLALIHALRGDLGSAATLEGYVNATLQAGGQERDLAQNITHHRLRTLLSEGLDVGELERRAVRGASLQPKAAIRLALAETSADERLKMLGDVVDPVLVDVGAADRVAGKVTVDRPHP